MFLLLVWLLGTRRVANDDAIAGNDAHSCLWAISGGSDAIGLSYGPISIVQLLGFCGGGGDDNQNMCGTEAICGGWGWSICCVDEHCWKRWPNLVLPPPWYCSHGSFWWVGARVLIGSERGGRKVVTTHEIVGTLRLWQHNIFLQKCMTSPWY